MNVHVDLECHSTYGKNYLLFFKYSSMEPPMKKKRKNSFCSFFNKSLNCTWMINTGWKFGEGYTGYQRATFSCRKTELCTSEEALDFVVNEGELSFKMFSIQYVWFTSPDTKKQQGSTQVQYSSHWNCEGKGKAWSHSYSIITCWGGTTVSAWVSPTPLYGLFVSRGRK